MAAHVRRWACPPCARYDLRNHVCGETSLAVGLHMLGASHAPTNANSTSVSSCSSSKSARRVEGPERPVTGPSASAGILIIGSTLMCGSGRRSSCARSCSSTLIGTNRKTIGRCDLELPGNPQIGDYIVKLLRIAWYSPQARPLESRRAVGGPSPRRIRRVGA